MNNQSPRIDYGQTATQAIQEPSLQDTASEALKWSYDVMKNLEALERTLIGGPNKPFPDAALGSKEVESYQSLETKLRLLSANCAGMSGFSATILNKVS